MAQTVVAVYDSHTKAVQAVESLREAGFRARDISIFAPDPREVEDFGDEVGVQVLKASAAGLAAGGLLGGLTGWLAGATALAVPGAGLVVAAGPFAVAALAAVGAASVGGFIGMLAGLGLPRHAAEEYDRELREGRTLVFVHANSDFARAELAMLRFRPVGVHHYSDLMAA